MSSKNTDDGNSKRRRGLGVVTANACTECRKKRAKCDGQVPCGRCSSQPDVECVYEVPMRKTKEDMRSEIESLRAQQRQNDRLMTALISTDQSEHIIRQLRIGSTIEGIVEQLETVADSIPSPGPNHHVQLVSRDIDQRGITHALQPAKAAMDIGNTLPDASGSRNMEGLVGQPVRQSSGLWLNTVSIHAPSHESSHSHSHLEDPMVWRPDNAPMGQHDSPLVGTWQRAIEGYPPPDSQNQQVRSHGENTILGMPNDLPELPAKDIEIKLTNWTRVTDDTAVVDHLMALYFCWEYPTFASLNKEHFMADYKSGSQNHCSPLLVNAMLAVGSRFSNLPQARADPVDSNTAGDHFFTEACKLLEQVPDRHILTVVQALGLMSIREASCGRSSNSLFFAGQSIRLAAEMGLHHEPEKHGTESNKQDEEVENAVRAATFWGAFSLDQAWSLSIGRLPHFSRDLKLVDKPAVVDHIDSQWVPYTDDGAPQQLSYIQPSNVRTVYRTFCELSEIVHQTLYTLYTPGTTLTSKTLNATYKKYLDFHARLPLALKLGENFTPAVIFTNMYFYYAMLLLFRPFIKLKILGVSQVSPRDICAQAAEAVSELVKSYSRLYTLRLTPSFVPYFVLTSTITHAVTHGTLRSDEKSEKLAQQGFESLKEMSKAHGFASEAMKILECLIRHWEIPISFSSEADLPEDYRLLCPPQATSMNQFCPYVDNVDVVNTIGKVAWNENPLFWPFPLQGRPLLNVGPMLDSLGFSVLPEYQDAKEIERAHLTEMDVGKRKEESQSD